MNNVNWIERASELNAPRNTHSTYDALELHELNRARVRASNNRPLSMVDNLEVEESSFISENHLNINSTPEEFAQARRERFTIPAAEEIEGEGLMAAEEVSSTVNLADLPMFADNIVTSLVSNSVNSANYNTEYNVLSSMPTDYSFQVTDKMNAKSAYDRLVSQTAADISLSDSIRSLVVGASSIFGPEAVAITSALDMTFGNILTAALGTLTEDDFKDTSYSMVHTYGDFGGDINRVSGTPSIVEDSVTQNNGNA